MSDFTTSGVEIHPTLDPAPHVESWLWTDDSEYRLLKGLGSDVPGLVSSTPARIVHVEGRFQKGFTKTAFIYHYIE